MKSNKSKVNLNNKMRNVEGAVDIDQYTDQTPAMDEIIIEEVEVSTIENNNPQGDASTGTVSKTFVAKLGRVLVALFAFLLPVIFIPTRFLDLTQSKVGLMVMFVSVLLILIGGLAINKGEIELPRFKIALPFVILFIVTLLSAIFARSSQSSFMGIGVEGDSWYFLTMCIVLMFLIPQFKKTKDSIFGSMMLLWIGFGIASIVQLIKIISGLWGVNTLTLGGVLPTVTSNLIGTWNDFGIFASVVALSLAITLDVIPLRKSLKIVFWIVFAISALLSSVMAFAIYATTWANNFSFISVSVVGVIALLVAVFQLTHRYHESEQSKIRFPLASLILVCLGVVFVISPNNVSGLIYKALKIDASQIVNLRPDYISTGHVISESWKSNWKNAVIGVGPQGFTYAWANFRPIQANYTDYWDVDFQYGASYVMTQFVDTGVLGLIAWLLVVLFIFWLGTKSLFRSSVGHSSLYTQMATFIPTIFLWIMMVFYTPSQTIIILTFVMTGLFFASLNAGGWVISKQIPFTGSRGRSVVLVLVHVVLVAGVLAGGVLWLQRTYASYIVSAEVTKYTEEVSASSANNSGASVSVDDLINKTLTKAYTLDKRDIYARTATQLALTKVVITQKTDGTGYSVASSSIPYLQAAISSAQSAVMNNPYNFRNYILLGSIAESAGLVGAEGAGDIALGSFAQAKILAKNHPLPSYLLAQLYILARDYPKAKEEIANTLRLKPNLTVAQQLSQQLSKSDVKLDAESMIKAPGSALTSTTTVATSTSRVPIKKTNAKAPVKK